MNLYGLKVTSICDFVCKTRKLHAEKLHYAKVFYFWDNSPDTPIVIKMLVINDCVNTILKKGKREREG